MCEATYTLDTGPIETQQTESTTITGTGGMWSERYGYTSLEFDGKMWVLGGHDGSHLNDVWYSEDGVNWYQTTGSAGWSPRRKHTSFVYDNKMWVMGGRD